MTGRTKLKIVVMATRIQKKVSLGESEILKEPGTIRVFKSKVTIKQKYCFDESSFCTEYFSFKASRKDIFIV